MRILLVSSVYPPRAGGPAAQTYHLARLLAQQDCSVSVLTFTEGQQPEKAEGVYVRSIPFNATWSGPVLTYAQAAYELERMLREKPFDVMHIMDGPCWLGLVATVQAGRHNLPVVAKIPGDMVLERLNPGLVMNGRSYDARRQGVRARLLTAIQRFQYHRFDLAWVASSFHDRILQETYHYPVEQIVHLPNYQHLTPFHAIKRSSSETSPVHVLSVLRFVPIKRVPDLVDIFDRVRAENVRMTIVGAGSPAVERQVQERIAALDLQDRICLAGHASPIEIPAIMAKADLFLHTGFQQWPGIVVVEAMASGLPVVVHCLSEPPPAEPYEQTNYICACSLDEAAFHVRDLIRNADSRRAIGRENVRLSGFFDLDASISEFLNLYRRAIEWKRRDCKTR